MTAAATNTAGGSQCYRFNPLGMDMPLFHRAVPQGEQISAAARPVNVAARLSRRVLCADLQGGVGAEFYGPTGSLLLTLGDTAVNPYQIKVANLSGPDGAWANLPADSDYAVVIDPELGRIALPPLSPGATAPQLNATYYYGFNADMGGGDYLRADSFVVDDAAGILPFPDTVSVPRYTTLPEAVAYATGQLAHTGEIAVQLAGSGTYAIAGGLAVDLPKGTTLEVRAADGARPTILLGGEVTVSGAGSSQLVLNGLVVGAGTGMTPGSPPPPRSCTCPPTVPMGRPTCSAGSDSPTAPWSLAGQSARMVSRNTAAIRCSSPSQLAWPSTSPGPSSVRSGPMRSPRSLSATASSTPPARTHVAYAAVDGAGGGAALTLSGCTVVGKVHAALLSLVSDSIVWAALAAADTWTAGLVADRKQEGCVRFSFLPYRLGHAAPLRVRRAGAGRASAIVLLAALRRPRIPETARCHRGRHPARGRRRR